MKYLSPVLLFFLVLNFAQTFAQFPGPLMMSQMPTMIMPNYQVPGFGPGQFPFPFYQGESMMMQQGDPWLMSQYQLPVGANLNVMDPYGMGGLTPDQMLQVQIASLPPAYSGPDYSYFSNDRPYYISKSDLDTHTSYSSDTHRYEVKAPVKIVKATKSEITKPKANTDAGVCIDCKSKAPAMSEQRKAFLESIRSKIFKDNSVPKAAFNKAWNYFMNNNASIKNQHYMTVIDYNKCSDNRRFYLINLENGNVENHLVSHGSGLSGKGEKKSCAVNFSNENHSTYKSSIGAYLTAETFMGGFNYSLKVDGLEASNSAARTRLIEVHGWDGVRETKLQQNELPTANDSEGCFALDKNISHDIINKIAHGSLLFVSTGNG